MIDQLQRLGVALLIGLLIGLERERAEARKDRPLFAGVRTFPLIALAGAIPVLLRDTAGPALLVASFLAVSAVGIVSYVRSSGTGAAGATTEIAAVGTFLLGALAGSGQLAVAGAAGVTVAVLLAAKPPLEAFSRAVTAEEMAAALELAVITVIVLPLLPDRGFGPWLVLNPRQIWIVVVLVSAFSFAAFVSMRLLGEARGMTLTGALGGLVSSTAVTLAMAQRVRAGGSPSAAAAAAVIASTLMCVRISVLAGLISRAVLLPLLPVLGVMTLAGGVAAWLLARGEKTPPRPQAPRIQNPFSLRAALAFAAVYAAVVVAVRAARELLGERGLYLAAALAGLADVDAPTVAFARLARGGEVVREAAAAIVIAAIMNTLLKLGLAAGLGRGPFRGQVSVALGAMSTVGALVGVTIFVTH